MRVLLDENLPRQLKRRLADLDVAGLGVASVNDPDLGWKGIRNGDLLDRMAGRFDVLVTADRSLRTQQKIAGRPLAVLVLPTNRRRDVLALAIQEVARSLAPGEVALMDRSGRASRPDA